MGAEGCGGECKENGREQSDHFEEVWYGKKLIKRKNDDY